MKLAVHCNARAASAAAAERLAEWLNAPVVRNVMLAAGNTPLELYRLVGARKLALANLNIFALDEYVGVPPDEPRNCANLIRRTAVEPWGVPMARYFTVSSLETDALASVQLHERKITEAGGLDVIVLGLGQNGHLGFNDFLYVTVGTGISCCLMLDGRPYLGASGATGTMASSPLSIPCEQCGHVSRRTLEEISAGPALIARFNAADGKVASGQEVLAAAAGGDARARQIVESASEALQSQIGLLVNTLDPEAVVIGGGLGLTEGPYGGHFLAATRRHFWSSLHRDLPIVRAATGVDAGWIGAAAKAWHEFSDSSIQSQTLKSKI